MVIVVSVYAASPFLDLGEQTRLGGIEAEYLTRTAYPLSTILPQKGYLPLWQPYLERGDPLLENPVSFAFNPFVSIPSYLFGLYDGVKIALLVAVICAGTGGWALGRVLGFGAVARLLVAGLVIGKGNFHAYLVDGHFPLVIVQAYFPWIFAAVVAICKGHRRWAVGLLMVSFVFVFLTGVPWYPPAILLSIGILTLFGTVERVSGSPRWRINWSKLGGVTLGVVGALFLSAVVMYPLLTKSDNIGESTIYADHRADVGGVMGLFFSSHKDLFSSGVYPQGSAFSFYNYMSPGWYALLIAALVVLIAALHRKRLMQDSRFVWGFLAVFIFTMLWGAGQNPVIELFYRMIPYATQFRHVQRAFAVSSLALIILLGMGVDVAWRYLVQTPLWVNLRWMGSRTARIGVRVGIASALVLTSSAAAYDVVRQWHVSWGEFFTQPEDPMEDACMTWLRQTYPDQELSVWTLGYSNIYTNLRNRVRHAWVGSDFYHIEGEPSTIFSGVMQRTGTPPKELLPEFAMGITHFEDSWLRESGYVPLEESVNQYTEGRPCLWRRENTHPYAWATTRAQLDRYTDVFPAEETRPLTTVIRDYDRVSVLAQAQPDEDVVVAISEAAYPGWQVYIDSQPAQTESLGGLVAVVLPRDDQQHTVLFRYLPPRFFLGCYITLATAILGILYLLRVDVPVRRRFGHRFASQQDAFAHRLSASARHAIERLDPLPPAPETPPEDQERIPEGMEDR